MAYNSKYTGAELEKKLDAVNDIPNLIDAILLNKNYITEEALKCFMKDYAPSDYSNIPIDNNTIYWENGLLKSKGGTGGGSDNCGCLWELRESKTGGYYLYSKYHVASKYGMSMYIEEATSEDGSGFIPDYVADLPIDNDTIYWSVNSLGNPILKAKVGTGGSEGNNSEFSKLFKGHYDEAGDLIYIEALSDMIVNGGITIYAGNNVDVDSIYDGLPIDNNTIKWIETTNSDGSIIKLLGINPDIDLGGVSTWDELEGKPSWITTSKPKWDYEVDIYNKPNLSIYATLEYVNNEFKKYVTLDTDQTIKGFKDFEKGLSIGGLPITKSQDDVIYLDANLVVRGGITMYAEGEVDIPSIIESLPIASTTAKGIASFDGTYFAVDSNGKVTLLAANVGLNEEELAAYLTEKKYATQSWVYSLGYAHSSDLNALQTKVNDFLEGSDTDTIINKWKELESFLSGLSESDNLATILGTKANQSDLDDTNEIVATKWTQDDTKINNWDNAYKWGNHADVGYALKSYVDNEFKKYVTLADDQTIGGVKTFTNGLKIGTSTINQSQSDVVYIDANLVVRGGITMYSDNTVDVGTIFDALPIDGNTIFWENGVLKANITEGVITNITSDMVVGALGFTPYNASNPKGYISGITSSMVVSALGYAPLQNHQTIYALTIQKNGTNIGTYTPNSAKKTINIVVPTKVSELDNDEEYTTTSDLDSRIDALINGAPTAFDTLKEIADVLQGNVNSIGDIITTLGTKADKAIKISAGTGLSGGGTLEADRTLSLATSGVTAGTYKSVTVDKYGRVTSGTNPTTLAGYGITDAYTKTKVDELLGNYVTIATKQPITGEKNFTGGLKVNGSPIVYDATNKYWKLEGDLLVTGGVTMFASDSAFTPSTIMDAIATDGTNLKVVKGVLTFVGSIDGGEAGSVAWENVENKPSWIGPTKPSYSYSEISGTPTLLSSFNNDVGFVTSSALDGYLPLSGGELSGRLDINQTSSDQPLTLRSGKADSAGACRIQFKDSSNTHQAYIMSGWGELIMTHRSGSQFGIGVAGIWYSSNHGSTKNAIYHAGNFNPSDYLPLSGGKMTGDIFFVDSKINKAQMGWDSIGGLYMYNCASGTQLGIKDNGTPYFYSEEFKTLYHTGNLTPTEILTQLKTVDGSGSGLDADLLDGLQPSSLSVLSASKLTNARTIWGQSFDGTGNVSGTLTLGYNSIIGGGDESILGQSTNGYILLGLGTSRKGFDTYIDGYNTRFRYGTASTEGMRLTSTGNVLIGTTTDSGYKLDVNGNIRAKKNVKILSEDGLYDGQMYISNGNLAFESSQIGVKLNDICLNPNGGKSQGHVTINNIPIYKSQDDVLYIDGNLAVRGGITMYATDAIDVPSIIDALPIASASAKGIAAFNPNDFSVVDGYVSFIGSTGGVDDSVLADYAKKTDLSKYLPLSGGRVTGQIEYNFDKGYGACSLPAAGVLETNLIFNNGAFNKYKSFLGNVHYTPNDSWYNVISVRADNSSELFGMYLVTSMTDSQDNLKWNRQTGYNGEWQGERVILDSVNWRDYVSVGGNPSYDGTLTVNGSDVRGSYPALRMHIPNVNWQQFMMRGDGIVELRYGDAGQNNRWGQLALGTIFLDDQRDDVLYFPGKEYFDNHGNIHIPNADGSWSWNIYNSNGSNVMNVHTNGNVGLGTTNPSYKLHVEGGDIATDNYIRILAWPGYGSGSCTMWYDGTPNTLAVSANILTYGGITMYSDIRKKTKLQDVELSLKQIADAPLIEHYYNSDEKRTTHVGSIAQYWAGINDWFCKLDSEGFYTMEIQNAALASAISIARELVKYESKTDKEIRMLKDEVKRLKKEIKILKSA